jgi:hypothetical protein
MLPRSIHTLLTNLYHETESGKLKWDYDYNSDTVRVETNQSEIRIVYTFNTIEEVGEFTIYYFDKKTSTPYNFVTNQNYNDYEKVRIMFDSAQASNVSFGF